MKRPKKLKKLKKLKQEKIVLQDQNYFQGDLEFLEHIINKYRIKEPRLLYLNYITLEKLGMDEEQIIKMTGLFLISLKKGNTKFKSTQEEVMEATIDSEEMRKRLALVQPDDS